MNDAAAPWMEAVHGDAELHARAQEILSLKSRLEALSGCAWHPGDAGHTLAAIRHAQQQVRESERRLSYVLNVTGEGIWDWDLCTNAVWRNPRWHELLGLDSTRLSDTLQDFQACLFPEDLPELMGALQRCLDGQGPYRHEHRVRRPDGSVIWVLDRGDVVERDAQGRPLRMVGSFADVTERRQAEELTQRLAFYDALTGLPNRRLMLDRLQHALDLGRRSGQLGALMFIDLDNFKALNDSHGHAGGDALLQEVARRLRSCLRANDTAARMGGDEFVVIAEDLGTQPLEAASQAQALASRLVQCIAQPCELEGERYCGSGSVGITLFGFPNDSAKELLKRADFAMYQAKDAGRNTLCFFDLAMQEKVQARAALAADLRHGLERGELFIHLQPVVDGLGHRVGAEALVRWRHPVRGVVQPMEFIALAEQHGLIQTLGRQVLEAACLQLTAWAGDAATRHLTLSVNVSARQFHQPGFVAEVLQTLRHTGADANLLKLELTESLLLHDLAEVAQKMAALRSHGVRFSIDDFGTGYSSLAYLKRLPLDEIKIDRSFVNDLLSDSNDASIVQTILLLARSLSLKVVAEGVETVGQQHFLAHHGCPFFQGYLFGRPMPAQAWETARA